MNKKLIVVANKKKVKFYLAKGLKLSELIEEHNIEELSVHHVRPDKSGSFLGKKSQQSHFFDPHTDAKDLVKQDFAKIIIQRLEKIAQQSNFDQVLFIVEPQILGYIRKNLSSNIRKLVTKEIAKDLVDAEKEVINKHILA